MRDLKEGRAAIEERARTDLGMVGPNETFFQVTQPAVAAGAARSGAAHGAGRGSVSRGVRRWAVVPAAGRGERFGGAQPKQYVPLLGRPVLSWSLARAARRTRRSAASSWRWPPGDRRFGRLPEARDPRVRSCPGGARRELSVANALAALEDEARDEDWVLVHDAARPCLHARRPARPDRRRRPTIPSVDCWRCRSATRSRLRPRRRAQRRARCRARACGAR